MLELDGCPIDCVESGEGPALLFLPGSYSTTAAWRQVQRLLPPGWRVVTTSLCGYGGTRDSRHIGDFGMAHEVRVVEAVARHIGQPVHLVGHSFGGTVAIAAALSGCIDVASLSLFEANPVGVLPGRGDGSLHDETWRMSRAFEAAVQDGEMDAPARIIDFWGGDGAYAAMPDAVKAYCRQTVGTNVLDWRTVFDFAVTAQDCSGLCIPVLLVRGGDANPAMVSITDELSRALPNARQAVVEGAGHFLVNSHAPRCAALLSDFLAAP